MLKITTSFDRGILSCQELTLWLHNHRVVQKVWGSGCSPNRKGF